MRPRNLSGNISRAGSQRQRRRWRLRAPERKQVLRSTVRMIDASTAVGASQLARGREGADGR